MPRFFCMRQWSLYRPHLRPLCAALCQLDRMSVYLSNRYLQIVQDHHLLKDWRCISSF